MNIAIWAVAGGVAGAQIPASEQADEGFET